MKALSLFTGCGGLDLGLEAAGFDNAICVEIDRYARATIETNRPKWKLCETGDILTLKPEEILEQAGLQPMEATLVAGGPPCQPFSKAAQWLTSGSQPLDDPRARTLRAYLRVVHVALPQVFLLEHVPGLSTLGSRTAQQLLEASVEDINRRAGTNYRLHFIVVDALDFGVPQRRRRVFVIADRDGRQLQPPARTHAPRSASGLRHLTSWDAIGDLDTRKRDNELKPTGKWADLLPSIPEGRNYLWLTSRQSGVSLFGWRTRYWSFLLKLAKASPSWTLAAGPGSATGPFHWRNRRLSAREICRLQSFKDDFCVSGPPTAVRRQLGNAVPPLLGEVFGRALAEQYFGVRTCEALTYAMPHRDDCPRRHPVRRVPDKYSTEIVVHPDHPGPGRGPGARERRRAR